MESEDQLNYELKEKVFQIFSDFMTRVTKFEELVAVGSRLLVSFQQGLEFVRRPPIDKKSELLERIFKVNETQRFLSYIKAGCINTHDSVENINKLHTCQLGLWDNLRKAKFLLNELECLVEDVRLAIETATKGSQDSHNEDNGTKLDLLSSLYEKEEMTSDDPFTYEATDYAAMVAIIYTMVKQDYVMQEKIVSSLNLKTSSGELESYSLMWSLRPFIDDEIIHEAWRRIP